MKAAAATSATTTLASSVVAAASTAAAVASATRVYFLFILCKLIFYQFRWFGLIKSISFCLLVPTSTQTVTSAAAAAQHFSKNLLAVNSVHKKTVLFVFSSLLTVSLTRAF